MIILTVLQAAGDTAPSSKAAGFQQSFQDFFAGLARVVPTILAFLVLVILGLVVALVLDYALRALLRFVRFDEVVARLLGREMWTSFGIRVRPSTVAGLGLRALTAFAFLGGAFSVIAPSIGANLLESFLHYLPRLAVGFLILCAGYLVSPFIGRTVLIASVNARLRFARFAAWIAQALVWIFLLAMALEQLGIGANIAALTFAILLSGLTFAVALAFGLGARDLARKVLEERLRDATTSKDQWDEFGQV